MWLYHANMALEKPLRWVGCVRAVDEGGSIPRRGATLLVANHSSFLDPWFVGVIVPRPVRNLITRKWFDKSPAWRLLFTAWGTIPVQDGDATATLAAIKDALDAGHLVGVFPEGRISEDGRMNGFRSGVAWMASQSGAPVVPLGIRGAYDCLPRHRKVPRWPRIRIHVGAPRYFPGTEDGRPVEPTRRDIVTFTRLLEDDVRRLAGQPTRESAEARRAATVSAEDDDQNGKSLGMSSIPSSQ